mmetsp:Transcript_82100/g.142717  ORF Transcript_82100/g.142717 Transcript_82100/m.142717 type:complete len:104 (+) Transcript_82100:51-362(+)
MPHSHSKAAASRRRARAVERGYIQLVPDGCAHVCVPQVVAQRTKLVAKSLAKQHAHLALAQQPSHTAAISALRVRQILSDEELKDTMLVHKAANSAKHDQALT